MTNTYEHYKLIKNSVQLSEVILDSLGVKRFDGEDETITVKFQRSANNLKPDEDGVKHAGIYLKTHLFFEGNGPLDIEVVYKGICSSKSDISQEELLEYANVQVVALLLPYARECITNVLSRMKLPLFYLPTMDILGSIEENGDLQQLGELHGDN